jgi:hypothetical protein
MDKDRHIGGSYKSWTLLMAALLVGCASMGPKGLEASRGDYNTAIQRTNSEEMLLNLVRLRYRETPLFLQVSDVSSQWDFTRSAEANVLWRTDASEAAREGGVGANLSYSDTPTVTMTPLQGEEFVQRLLQPVTLDILLLLYQSGWPIDGVLRLTAERLNGIQNAPTASGGTPDSTPTYADFLDAVRLLRRLQTRGILELGYRQDGEETTPVLRIAPHATHWPEVRELRAILGLNPAVTTYLLTTDTATRDPDHIGVGTRSVIGMMSYLSQSVVAPEAHVNGGLVTVTRHESGEPFDWNELLGDFFQVRSTPQEPGADIIAVRYRDNWFYIADTDLVSKSTFTLIQQLFALQAGELKQTGPVLTLPVGR